MDISYDTLVRQAWRENKVNASAQGFATEPMLGAAYPPRAWVDQELGFGFGEGPSLQLTLLHLGAQNRRARKMLERAEPKKRESRLDRERRLDRLVEAARQERAAR